MDKSYFIDCFLHFVLMITPSDDLKGPCWWYVNIGSRNDLVLSGTKPLPELMWPSSMSWYDVSKPKRVNNWHNTDYEYQKLKQIHQQLKTLFQLSYSNRHQNQMLCDMTHQPSWCWIYMRKLKNTLIVRFMGPTWGPPGDDRTQVGPMLAPWTLLSGYIENNACTRVTNCFSAHESVILVFIFLSWHWISEDLIDYFK